MRKQVFKGSVVVIAVCMLSTFTARSDAKQFETRNLNKPQAVLTGRIANPDSVTLKLFYVDKAQREHTKEINIAKGAFAISSKLITRPQVVYLSFVKKDKQVNFPVLLAPNYNLRFIFNALNFKTSRNSLKLSGRGTAMNNFYKVMNTNGIYYDVSRKITFEDWYKSSLLTADSLYKHARLEFNDPHDTYANYFRDLIYKNLLFQRLDALMREANKMLADQSPFEVNDYIKNHFDSNLLRNISASRYLACPSYKDLMGVSNYYLFYIFNRDLKIHPVTIDNKYQAYLDKIAVSFNGPVREYIFYRFINLNLLAATNSYEEFHKRAAITKPFLDKFVKGDYYASLNAAINKKDNELAKLKAGDPAPDFVLTDEKGNSHALSDFKGKIIVLDFWASWCTPCRRETPYLAKLVEKYSNDDRLCFVSIAVRDRKDAWLNALKKDGSSWLQLFDNADKAGKLYFTQAIPKFVIINGKGRIANFDAPEPSDGHKMEDFLENELTNQ